MIENNIYGDPESELRWTSLSLRKIQKILEEDYSIIISHSTIARILKDLGISRKKNKKYNQIGQTSKFREHQFIYIKAIIEEFKSLGLPIISIDSKYRIVLGNYSNNGTIYTKDEPIKTFDHDFITPDTTKLHPFGIYCLNNNTVYMNLNTTHDTSEFAANSIIFWWNYIGKYQFPKADRILILSDCGGSNRARGQAWKEQLLIVALMTGLNIAVSHYPSGCSKLIL